MADCTVEQVYEHARFRLNDLARDGGEVFTNDRLRRAFVSAWEEFTHEAADNQIPASEKTVYLTLPAYTSELHPDLFGLVDFGELQSVKERPAQALRSITGASSTSPIQVTVDTTGLQSNQVVIVCGVGGQGGANGRFFITVDDATHATLRGSKSTGDYTSGGTLSIDAGEFVEVSEKDELPDQQVGDRLGVYSFNSGYFQFLGCTQDVQLMVKYLSSGAAPETGLLGVDLGLNFFACRTAAVAALASPMHQQAGMVLAQEAVQHLNTLLSSLVRERQRAPQQKRMYGSRAATLVLPYLRTT